MTASSFANPPNPFGKEDCIWLANKYFADDKLVLHAALHLAPEQFIRLFVTAYGMKPVGHWQTHTYARIKNSVTNLDHFFLIPINDAEKNTPHIRIENDFLKIDHITTNIYLQSIPYTTPFWYFHYNPNKEEQPFYSLTLNLSPSCLEKCVLCAGAKTGRVNNGMESTLSAKSIGERIFTQHPLAKDQLDEVAIVTGCFGSFDELRIHLTEVKHAINQFAAPPTFRVLEHNITTEKQFEMIVGDLGYEIFITLECFDQNVRNIALNGKVGRKGRDSKEFIEMIKAYAFYLDSIGNPKKTIINVTYLIGLDSLSTTEYFFQQLSNINKMLKHTIVIPWLSIYTSYSKGMRSLAQKEFDLRFILNAISLSEKYFDPLLLATHSGGTTEGYARGLF